MANGDAAMDVIDTPPTVGTEEGARGPSVTWMQKFLRRFGYFDSSPADVFEPDETFMRSAALERFHAEDHVLATTSAPTEGVFDAATRDALERFQKFNGLAVTGAVDKATLDGLKTHRCGNPDRTGLAAFVTGVGKWESTNLTYSFQNYSSDLSEDAQRWAIDHAFGLWSGVTPLRFRRLADGTSGDIVIRFVSGDHGDGAPFDGPGNVLAHAFFPSNSGPIRGDSHFDEAETWTVTVPTGSAFDLVTVATHEFGHALGLRHSEVADAMMAPRYVGPRRFLSPDDVAGIQSLYGGTGALENATWIHGNGALIEHKDNVEFQRYYGFYNRIVGKPGSTNWFHFAVSTPVIEDGVRLVLDRFMVRAFSGNNAVLRDVHIRDGDRVVALHNQVNRSGNMPFEVFGVASMPEVRWGLSVGLGFDFSDGNNNDRRVDLISVGFDFKRP